MPCTPTDRSAGHARALGCGPPANGSSFFSGRERTPGIRRASFLAQQALQAILDLLPGMEETRLHRALRAVLDLRHLGHAHALEEHQVQALAVLVRQLAHAVLHALAPLL